LTKSFDLPADKPNLAPAGHYSLDSFLVRELRSDHAGETGAVYIYKGIAAVAAVSKQVELLHFAHRHGATEAVHLALMESVLGKKDQSRLLSLWRLAGWFIGALPALFGTRAVYATIAAVETFVERHYQGQIDYLMKKGSSPELLQLLQRCQADEVEHKKEAVTARGETNVGFILRSWCALMNLGSRGAVAICRNI